ncbi:uncharacterized protein B0T23DRAFT_115287 [Neurospora hispaniola]|uniref:Secreted protein n=1 Tax=Neurospora hispaniola TaxID=588809 RepID=A0AAJ0MSG3_9PEZI|nr:hypothetical protein B0T23DRAFT_115287 [Neurospora hispaniola]
MTTGKRALGLLVTLLYHRSLSPASRPPRKAKNSKLPRECPRKHKTTKKTQDSQDDQDRRPKAFPTLLQESPRTPRGPRRPRTSWYEAEPCLACVYIVKRNRKGCKSESIGDGIGIRRTKRPNERMFFIITYTYTRKARNPVERSLLFS